MEQNPFECRIFDDFIEAEDLDRDIGQMREAVSMAWQFNPWSHRVVNWSVSKLSVGTRNNQYDWNDFDPDNYVGPNRRRVVRDALDDFITSCRAATMPRTKKMKHLDEAG